MESELYWCSCQCGDGCGEYDPFPSAFSVPDEGPLTDFESWMPDFMSGLAEGIEKSRGLVKAAVDSVAADMVISPQMAVADGGVMIGMGSSGGADPAGIVSALKDVLSDQKGQQGIW